MKSCPTLRYDRFPCAYDRDHRSDSFGWRRPYAALAGPYTFRAAVGTTGLYFFGDHPNLRISKYPRARQPSAWLSYRCPSLVTGATSFPHDRCRTGVRLCMHAHTT